MLPRFTAAAQHRLEADSDAEAKSDTGQVQDPFGDDKAHVEEEICRGQEGEDEQGESQQSGDTVRW